MATKINPTNPLTPLYQILRKPKTKPQKQIKLSSCLNPQPTKQSCSNNDLYSVTFKTLGSGKLGISRYPDFEYDPQGGFGSGTAMVKKKVDGSSSEGELWVCFDVDTVYIPPLTSKTTKFLGLPLPPFLKIDILPEVFQGTIDLQSGKVELEFVAKFSFSAAGGIYKAAPLVVKTVMTSEESRGERKRGRGERMDVAGKCRLVGVAVVDTVDDLFLNAFLSLPTECLADLHASISLSPLMIN
ncbi:PREDICTED: uncharacterized protein LOC104826810 [Tarenaya hassleriana]|uniref:uncharacterized protein LOC104826810 n=1 Tax=Tarenaya hassleriana TaxID=28532 RepID=UPI00053C698F|nr:PREDICTED: uncharacterized protein LOC104826810 [Tarenaya hassleriana]